MKTIDDIAAVVDKVRWSNQNSFQSCCPAHDDKAPSLSVTQDGDMLLMYCHAGCSQDEVLDAVGIRESSPYRPPRQRVARPVVVSATRDYALDVWSRIVEGASEFHSWDGAVASHPYAVRKKITHAWGAARGYVSGRLVGKNADCIVIPMRDTSRSLCGIECINAQGVKQTFGSKGTLVLGNTLDHTLPLYICEGWATAWGVQKLLPGGVIACAFGKSRMSELFAITKTNSSRDVYMVEDGDE